MAADRFGVSSFSHVDDAAILQCSRCQQRRHSSLNDATPSRFYRRMSVSVRLSKEPMPISHDLESKNVGERSATMVPHHPERRNTKRGGVRGEPSRSQLTALILGTYAEMPGLSLHLHQAARLFGLRQATCLVVLSDLVRDGQLRRSSDGQYRPADSGVV
jgi:hypothetical protein